MVLFNFGLISLVIILIFLTSIYTSKPKKFTVELNNGKTTTTYEINPSPMLGEHTLKISVIKTKIFIAKEIKEVKFIFQKKPYKQFFCERDTFAIQLINMQSNKPMIVGMFLPEWNMKGTYRAKVTFPKPIKIQTGKIYEISMALYEKDTRISKFKVESGKFLLLK